MRIEEIIYKARNNAIVLRLSVDDPLTGVAAVIQPTRVQLKVGSTLLDSATNPTYFDFSTDNIVKIYAGAASLTVGKYTATLYIFDSTHTLGLRWCDFLVEVKD